MIASRQMSIIIIMRLDPSTMTDPNPQEFQVPYDVGHTVLDGLNYIYRVLDNSLAFRSSCQSGLCLVCLIQIDGVAKYPCKTLMKGQIKLEPLKNKKVIRDLVVEIDASEMTELFQINH